MFVSPNEKISNKKFSIIEIEYWAFIDTTKKISFGFEHS